MLLILILIFYLIIIYYPSGIYLIIPLILSIINIAVSTFLLIFSPDSFKLKIIRIICIFFIVVVTINSIKQVIDFIIQCL